MHSPLCLLLFWRRHRPILHVVGLFSCSQQQCAIRRRWQFYYSAPCMRFFLPYIRQCSLSLALRNYRTIEAEKQQQTIRPNRQNSKCCDGCVLKLCSEKNLKNYALNEFCSQYSDHERTPQAKCRVKKAPVKKHFFGHKSPESVSFTAQICIHNEVRGSLLPQLRHCKQSFNGKSILLYTVCGCIEQLICI